MWHCFCNTGPGNPVRMHGIMDSMKYQEILLINEKLTAAGLWLDFQQDKEKKWLDNHRIKLQTCPS